jgi:hypothetical protein
MILQEKKFLINSIHDGNQFKKITSRWTFSEDGEVNVLRELL